LIGRARVTGNDATLRGPVHDRTETCRAEQAAEAVRRRQQARDDGRILLLLVADRVVGGRVAVPP